MNYCNWTAPNGVEYEIHYSLDCGEIVDFSLYHEPDFELSREQEREIFELIYDDFGEDE